MDRAKLIQAIVSGSKEELQNAMPPHYSITEEDIRKIFFEMVDNDTYTYHNWEAGTQRKPKKEEWPVILPLIQQYVQKVLKQPHTFDSAGEYERKLTIAIIEEILLTSRKIPSNDRRIGFKFQQAQTT